MRITPPHRNRNGISSRWDMKLDQDPHRISQFDGGGPEADDGRRSRPRLEQRPPRRRAGRWRALPPASTLLAAALPTRRCQRPPGGKPPPPRRRGTRLPVAAVRARRVRVRPRNGRARCRNRRQAAVADRGAAAGRGREQTLGSATGTVGALIRSRELLSSTKVVVVDKY